MTRPLRRDDAGSALALLGRRWRTTRQVGGVAALVALSILARIPFLARPLSPDEGGFLMVAAQWSPGSSLYGDYWVDRPPLLVGIFCLADRLGGSPMTLRAVGVVWVAAAVLLAGTVGRVAAPRNGRAPAATAATAAVFLVSPMFGATSVNGELLAAPLVLAGLAALLRAWSSGRADVDAPRPRELWWWALCGVCGVAAAAVKQNMLGVVVLTALSGAVLLLRGEGRRAMTAMTAAGAGAMTALVVLLAWSSSRGTGARALLDAVVTFRMQAAAVIATSASSATPARAWGLAGAFALSGAIVLLIVPGVATVTRRAMHDRIGASPAAPLGLFAAVLVGWELLAVLAGGSFWHHYLIGVVPGLVLTVAWVLRCRPGRRSGLSLLLSLLYSAAASTIAVVVTATSTAQASSTTAVAHFLSTHARSGETAVTAFGDPALLYGADLRSPYPQLWSLPVRVRDPDLARFTALLRGPDAPTWVVVAGASIDTWGVDATGADHVLARRYRLVTTRDVWHIYRIDPVAEDGCGRCAAS